jgi:hypothetical protein
MKIRPLALGVALGLVWGVSLLVTTLVSARTGYAREFLAVMAGSIYPGYAISPAGSLLGLLYGFVDGLVGGAVLAWIYNRLAGAR